MTCDSHEWLDHHTIDDAVEEPPFERNEIQKAPRPVWREHLEISATLRRLFSDRAFQSMQIVRDVRRTQKLQQSKARVTSKMDECDGVPAERNFDDDDTYLCQRRV